MTYVFRQKKYHGEMGKASTFHFTIHPLSEKLFELSPNLCSVLQLKFC